MCNEAFFGDQKYSETRTRQEAKIKIAPYLTGEKKLGLLDFPVGIHARTTRSRSCLPEVAQACRGSYDRLRPHRATTDYGAARPCGRGSVRHGPLDRPDRPPW